MGQRSPAWHKGCSSPSGIIPLGGVLGEDGGDGDLGAGGQLPCMGRDEPLLQAVALRTSAWWDAAPRARTACTEAVGTFAKETCPFSSPEMCHGFPVFLSVQDMIRQLAKGKFSSWADVTTNWSTLNFVNGHFPPSNVFRRWSWKRSWALSFRPWSLLGLYLTSLGGSSHHSHCSSIVLTLFSVH